MKTYAIVLAAGKGSRMKAGINKQFLEIDSKPILYYSLNEFQKHEEVQGIVIVSAETEKEKIKKDIVDKYGFTKVISITAGGKERSDSVLNGLRAMKEQNADIVLIHDGARPFIDNRIISDGIKYSLLHESCSCGVKSIDTMKIVGEDGFFQETLNRESLFSIQTPQCFKYDLIYECHNKVKQLGYKVTDDTSVVERFGHRVYLYQGSYNNIKVTTPKDMIQAQEIYKNLFTK